MNHGVASKRGQKHEGAGAEGHETETKVGRARTCMHGQPAGGGGVIMRDD